MDTKELAKIFGEILKLTEEHDAIPVLRGFEDDFQAGLEIPRHQIWRPDQDDCELYFGRQEPIKGQYRDDFDVEEEIKKLGETPQAIEVITSQYNHCEEFNINRISSNCDGDTPEEALGTLKILCCLLKKGYILISESDYDRDYYNKEEDSEDEENTDSLDNDDDGQDSDLLDDDSNPFEGMFDDDEDEDDEDDEN